MLLKFHRICLVGVASTPTFDGGPEFTRGIGTLLVHAAKPSNETEKVENSGWRRFLPSGRQAQVFFGCIGLLAASEALLENNAVNLDNSIDPSITGHHQLAQTFTDKQFLAGYFLPKTKQKAIMKKIPKCKLAPTKYTLDRIQTIVQSMNVGNCWQIAAVISVLSNNPDFLSEMIDFESFDEEQNTIEVGPVFGQDAPGGKIVTVEATYDRLGLECPREPLLCLLTKALASVLRRDKDYPLNIVTNGYENLRGGSLRDFMEMVQGEKSVEDAAGWQYLVRGDYDATFDVERLNCFLDQFPDSDIDKIQELMNDSSFRGPCAKIQPWLWRINEDEKTLNENGASCVKGHNNQYCQQSYKDESDMFDKFKGYLNAKKVVVLSRNPKYGSVKFAGVSTLKNLWLNNFRLVPNHAYSLLDVKKYPETGRYMALIRNPWPDLMKMHKGHGEPFWIDLNLLQAFFTDIEVGKLQTSTDQLNNEEDLAYNYDKFKTIVV